MGTNAGSESMTGDLIAFSDLAAVHKLETHLSTHADNNVVDTGIACTGMDDGLCTNTDGSGLIIAVIILSIFCAIGWGFIAVSCYLGKLQQNYDNHFGKRNDPDLKHKNVSLSVEGRVRKSIVNDQAFRSASFEDALENAVGVQDVMVNEIINCMQTE